MSSNKEDKLSIDGNRMFLKSNVWTQCGRRVPRVDLVPGLYSIRILMPSISSDTFEVKTLGELGAFCETKVDGLDLEPDHMVDGVLMIGDDCYDFEGRIRYMRETGMAIEFCQAHEGLRKRVRTNFQAELLATTLSPFLSYTTMEPGSTGTLIYSDGASNNIHISLLSQKILGVFLDLEVLDVQLEWRKSGSKKTGEFNKPLEYQTLMKVLNFLKNLPGIEDKLYIEIEHILTEGRVLDDN